MLFFLLCYLSFFLLLLEVNLVELFDFIREPLELPELLRFPLRSVEIFRIITFLKQMEYPSAGAPQDDLISLVTLLTKDRPQAEAVLLGRLLHLLVEHLLPEPS